jgi:hypothetical protein
VKDGFDLAIRTDILANFSRRIGYASWIACTSPTYLAGNGEPGKPTDLTERNCLTYPPCCGTWRFTNLNVEYVVAVQTCAAMTCTDCKTRRTPEPSFARSLQNFFAPGGQLVPAT